MQRPDHSDSAFVRACRGLPHDHVPVWFMRQAGRALPEYRAIRGSGSILDAIAKPDVAIEITRQPVDRYGVDAAVLFSDIVTPIHAIGFGVDIAPGIGPVIADPFRGPADLERLRPLEPELDTPYVIETIDGLVATLDVPLIGFAGAPFTVASYLLEGRPSRTYEATKSLMFTDENLWHQLLDRLADIAIASLRSQVAHGAAAIQLFDSWAGALSAADYERFVLPHSAKVLAAVADLDVPRIHFGVHTGELLGLFAAAGADVVGVDWRTTLTAARTRVPAGTALQGNLDPARIIAGWDATEAGARDVLADNDGHPAHVFNLGHGVLPDSDPAILQRLVDLVHTEGRVGPTPTPIARAADAVTDMIGALVMAYGTPASPADVEAYYTHVRRGRPPTDEQLADLVRRYDAIGGVSPLAANTAAQRAAIASALGDGWVVEGGSKHAAPFIEDGVAALVAQGVDAIVGVVLAPHYSAASVGEYHERGHDAAGRVPYVGIERWYDLDEFADHQAASLRARLDAATPDTKVLFTAHSLPERSLVGDPYPDQLFAGATTISARAGMAAWGDWAIAWQSAGRTPEPWRGPDVLAVIADLAATGRADGLIVVPHGFTSEHLEVLFDLDIEAKRAAEAVGLQFARTDVVGDDAVVMAALARRVAAAAP